MADKVVRMKSGEIVEVRHNTHKRRASEVSWDLMLSKNLHELFVRNLFNSYLLLP